MPFFPGAVGRVYYRHWATPDPRAAIVFLHGFGEHTGLYHRYAAELGAHGIDLWALDEVGHGLSDGERGHFGSLEALVANAHTLTDLAAQATPGVPIALAGHSLGSVAAVLTAFERPERYTSLVLTGAPLSPLAWLAEAAGDSVDLDPAALSSDPFYLDSLENDPLAFTSADITEVLSQALPAAWRRFDADLADLVLPVLAVHGENDEVAPLDGVRAWEGRLPGLRVEAIAGAGHDILNEVAHRQVADLIAQFVLAQRVRVPA